MRCLVLSCRDVSCLVLSCLDLTCKACLNVPYTKKEFGGESEEEDITVVHRLDKDRRDKTRQDQGKTRQLKNKIIARQNKTIDETRQEKLVRLCC